MTGTEHKKQLGNRLAASVLLACLSVAFAALVIEAAARFALDDGMHFDLEMWKYAHGIKFASEDSRIGHEHTPNASGVYMGVPVAINSAGYRDREYPLLKPEGDIRIMMLGDSLTFGWGAKVEDTFADQLEALLNKGGGTGKTEVINTGVGNYNTAMQVAAFLRNGHKFNPDVIVLNYFINDAEPTPQRKKNSFTEYSYAAVMLTGAFDTVSRLYLGKSDWKKYYADLYREDQPGWLQAKAAVAQLAAYCREKGIKLIMVNLPELHELSPYPFSEVIARLSQLADQLGIAFHDTLPALAPEEPQSLWVSPTDAHPNAKADKIIAAEIAAAIGKFFPELRTQ